MEPQLPLSTLTFALPGLSSFATYYFHFRNTRASRVSAPLPGVLVATSLQGDKP